tara:strand:- start:1575 stop:1733 length:159 start_codon:yes stop_codon:yes gene_type:complete
MSAVQKTKLAVMVMVAAPMIMNVVVQAVQQVQKENAVHPELFAVVALKVVVL